MFNNKKNATAFVRTSCIASLPLLIAGCFEDIQYKYDIPQNQSDCAGGMTFRSGGSGIVDRDGGSGIRDRDGNEVTSYCEEAACPSNNFSSAPPIIDWHLTKGDFVVANRICLPWSQ